MKRCLTIDEINDILDNFPYTHNIVGKIKEYNIQFIRDKLKKSLSDVKIYPQKIDDLKNILYKSYCKSVIQPGEHVGILAAQSIGKEQTQMTLNSFHVAGQAVNAVIVGVPRFTQLLNVSKNPKNVINYIYLKRKYETPFDLLQGVRGKIQQLTFQGLVKNVIYDIDGEYYTNHTNHTNQDWYCLYDPAHLSNYNCRVKYILKKDVMYEYKLSPIDVCNILNSLDKTSDVFIIPSPQCVGRIDVLLNVDFKSKLRYYKFIELKSKVKFILNLILVGISKITHTFYKKDEYDDLYIEAHGSNFDDIIKLPIVDPHKTYTDNLWEMYDKFGIETVREFMFKEFYKLLSDDSYINSKHIDLLVDSMCYTGALRSISRYGIDRDVVGPLAKASFEECLDNFTTSGLRCETDNMTSTCSSIISGQHVKYGTCGFDLIYQFT